MADPREPGVGREAVASDPCASEGSSGEANGPSPAQRGSVKRPYAPPRLRSLGKVSELTFGGGSAKRGDGLGNLRQKVT